MQTGQPTDSYGVVRVGVGISLDGDALGICVIGVVLGHWVLVVLVVLALGLGVVGLTKVAQDHCGVLVDYFWPVLLQK